MKYLTKKRIVWTAAALSLLWLGKIFLYDEFIRCHPSPSLPSSQSSPLHSSTNQPLVTPPPPPLPSPPTTLDLQVRETETPALPLPQVEVQIDVREEIESHLTSASLLFDPTIRSCLGSKCFDMPAQGRDRIGLLALPSSGADSLLKIIQRIQPNLHPGNAEILYENAVPAYGYGKNHGWSRIIRLVRSPLLQALQLLSDKQSFESFELESQVRQLVRWHCRLSHVAAHTRMLTVFVDDLMMRPLFHLEQILSFTGIPLPDRVVLRSLADELQLELRSRLVFENTTHLVSSFTTRSSLNGHNDLKLLVKRAANSLREEVVETKGLSTWPCRSFRSISPAPIIPTRLLAPNCSSPWVTCSVDYDRQEAAEASRAAAKFLR